MIVVHILVSVLGAGSLLHKGSSLCRVLPYRPDAAWRQCCYSARLPVGLLDCLPNRLPGYLLDRLPGCLPGCLLAPLCNCFAEVVVV